MTTTAEAPGFQLELAPVEEVPDTHVIRISGDVAYTEAHTLRSRAMEAMKASGSRRIVLELSDIRKMDTAGVAVIVELLRAGLRNGQKVVLCHPSDSVINIFRLAGVQDALEVCCSSVEEVHERLAE